MGELIASEVEVRTGKLETFADAAAWPSAARSCRSSSSRWRRSRRDGHASLGPLEEQRIIDTPHYRRNDELLRYVVWRNNSFGLHVHVGSRRRPRDRGLRRLRNFLPSCSRCRRARRSSRTSITGLHSARTQIFTRFSRAAGSRTCSPLGRVRALRPVPLRHGLDHRAHAALVERAAAPRVPDRRDQDLRRAARARRGAIARRPAVRARSADRACLDAGGGRPPTPTG